MQCGWSACALLFISEHHAASTPVCDSVSVADKWVWRKKQCVRLAIIVLETRRPLSKYVITMSNAVSADEDAACYAYSCGDLGTVLRCQLYWLAACIASKGVWRNGSASDPRSEGWEFESLCLRYSSGGDCRHVLR